MKTQAQIVQAFYQAQPRLDDHGIAVRSDGKFYLVANEIVVHETETVEGLAAFADALDYLEGGK